MKTNITFICLLPNYSRNVGKMLCDKLDMYFADVEDMLDFELGDMEHILSVLGDKEGKKYLRETEARVIKRIASFENTLVCVDPTKLFSNRNFERLQKTCYMVYLQISPKNLVSQAEESKDIINEKALLTAFSDRDKIYVEKSDILVNCSDLKEKKAVKKVVSAINSFFKKSKKEEK